MGVSGEVKEEEKEEVLQVLGQGSPVREHGGAGENHEREGAADRSSYGLTAASVPRGEGAVLGKDKLFPCLYFNL